LQHQPYRARAAELYTNYNTLDIPGLHNYQGLCLLVRKFLFCNKMLPFVFENYFTQNCTVHKYNTKQSYNL